MPEKTRQCKDCKTTFLYIPRRTRCVDCYKIYTKFITIPVTFINEDD